MTPAELAADRAIIAAASPSPWEPDAEEMHSRETIIEAMESIIDRGVGTRWHWVALPPVPGDANPIFTAMTGNGPTSEANARFIAAARTRWEAALEEIERLRRDLGNLLAVILRDGGHRQAEIGTTAAVEEAHLAWAATQGQLANALEEIERLKRVDNAARNLLTACDPGNSCWEDCMDTYMDELRGALEEVSRG